MSHTQLCALVARIESRWRQNGSIGGLFALACLVCSQHCSGHSFQGSIARQCALSTDRLSAN